MIINDRLQQFPLPGKKLKSKSGDGYHVYFFFDHPVPAWKARAVALAFLDEAQILNAKEVSCGFDRLFPSQDELSGRGFGNLIAFALSRGCCKSRTAHSFLRP